MDQQHSSSTLIPAAAVLLFLVTFAPLSLQDDRDRTFHDCYSTENSTTTSSAFTTNLNTFLSNLTSQMSPLMDYYPTAYNDSVGAPGPDVVFGFAQCISAGTAGDCGDCLRWAPSEILHLCPRSKKAFLLHTYCILRYSNESFFSKPDQSVREVLWSANNSTDPWSFNTKMADLMGKLSPMAASSPYKIALGFIKYDDYPNIYGMAQCTRDISSNDCIMCLMNAIGYVPFYCRTKKGCTAYAPSCSIRYENYVFTPAFNTSTDVLALPPQPPQTASNSSPPPLSEVGVLPAVAPSKSNGSKSHKKIIGAAMGAIAFLILLLAIGFTGIARKKFVKRKGGTMLEEIDDSKSLLFHLHVLKTATDGFSEASKLGQGGFGSVYKGTLSDGQEIAVKRLLATSNQGTEELITEVALLAKLQHRNLVKLLGCCLQKQEKLLVYEYMPNNSLEKLLFDPIRKSELPWAQRYKIIRGIANGLLYLHEESRLKIIHRDLKASNILLDANLFPKISDFGLAKIVSTDHTQGNTNRIAGTYGYMAPEYAMNGNFSTKSDVFSFGVLILEIITGRKNSSFSEVEGTINLLDHVWRHWTYEGSRRNLIDEKLRGHYHVVEVSRCIHIGLLCVQQDATKRPNMSTVVLMLSSFSITLPTPSPPAFCAQYFPSTDIASFQSAVVRTGHTSLYEASITELDPR